jgi:hypothetical protein
VRDTFRTDLDSERIELLLQQAKYAEAKACLSQRIDQFPSDRKARLYLLLVNVNLYGPEPFEREIDALRELFDVNETEKTIIRRIFLLGYRAAERRGQEKLTWAYQRLLRRLLLDQPLDQPIPKSFQGTLANAGRMPLELAQERRVEAAESRDAFMAHRRGPVLVQSPWIPRWFARVAVIAAVCGLLTAPVVYFSFWRSLKSAHPTVAAPRRAFPSKTENAVIVAEAPALAPRQAITSKREESPSKRFGRQLFNLRRAYRRWIGNKQNLTGSVVLGLNVDREGRVTQVDEISSQWANKDLVQDVVRQARNWKFSGDTVHGGKFAVTLLFLSKGKDRGAVAETRSNNAQTQKIARSAVAAPPAPRIADKKRKVQHKARHVRAQKPEIAATVDARGAASGAAKTIGFATTKRRITLRKEPRFAAASVEQIGGGISVRVLEVRGRWLKVKAADAKTAGFVRREFLTPVN